MKSHPRHPCPLYTPFFIHFLPKCRFFRCKQAELQTASQLFQNDPAANTAGFHPMGALESTTQTEVDVGARGSGRGWGDRKSVV